MNIDFQCWNCFNLIKANSSWELAQCPICNKVNKITSQLSEIYNKLPEKTNPYIHDYLFTVCPNCETDNQTTNKTRDIKCYKCGNIYSLRSKNNQLKAPYNNMLYNSYSFPIQDRNFPQPVASFKGPYFPYLPPPDFEWHKQMDEYIARLNKINKITKVLREDYKSKFSILDEYTRPKVYAIKTLIDSAEDINFRREQTYRDLLRGDYNLGNYDYKDLINKRRIADFNILRGDFISNHRNIHKFKQEIREDNNKGKGFIKDNNQYSKYKSTLDENPLKNINLRYKC